jgi:3-oxoacyl-(acyl-carrier-protein) synthase
MSDQNAYIKIYSGNQVSVILLKGLLEEAGIPVIEKNEQNSGVIAGFVGGTQSTIRLSVQEKNKEKAEKIIADFKAPKPE